MATKLEPGRYALLERLMPGAHLPGYGSSPGKRIAKILLFIPTKWGTKARAMDDQRPSGINEQRS